MQAGRQIISILFLLLSAHSTIAQEPYYLRIDESRGLPSNSVYDIFQDSKGFIWIAHNEGLSRYDGREFKTYDCPEQTSRAGSYIKEDNLGRIWYENFDGNHYYVEHDTLKPFIHPKQAVFARYGIINNHIIIAQANGVCIYNISSMKIVKCMNFDLNYVTSSECSLNRFYLVEDTIFAINETGIIDTIQNFIKNGKPYLGTAMPAKEAIVIYDKNNRTKECYQVKGKSCSKKFALPFDGFIQTDSYTDSCYWFCTSDGVYGFRESGIALNNGQPYFKSKSISKVLKDREGNFWFGTTNDGVMMVPDLNTRVFGFDYVVTKLVRAGTSLVFSSKSGKLYKTSVGTMQPKQIYDNGVNKEMFYLDYDSISGMILSTSNKFAVNDLNGKLYWKTDVSIKSCNRVNANFFAFAATGAAGFFSLDKNVDITKSPCYKKPVIRSGNLNHSQILEGIRGKATAYDIKSNTVYMAFNTGLFALINCKAEEIKHNGLSMYVTELEQNDRRIFALSSLGRLYEIFTDNQVKELHLTSGSGDIVCNDIRIAGGILFMITNKGLMYMNLSDRKEEIFNAGMNILGAGISDLEIIHDTLVVATNQGIVLTTIKKLVETKMKPVFVITGFRVNNKPLNTISEMQLEHNQNNVEISYSVLAFRNPMSENLYYRINDGNWELTNSGNGLLKLAAMAPGGYKIQFRLDNTNVSELEFWVKKPFWLTWSALILFSLLVLSIFVAIYKWQTGILKRQNQLLQQKFDLEKDLRVSVLKSIKAQMNPHFFYNALNTIQSFIFSDDKRNAATYLSKFSKLTRTILEMSEKESVTLVEEIEALTLYLDIEKVRFDNDFNFIIEKQPEINAELVKIPSMIIQPYVENAIKHGLLHKKEAKFLLVKFSMSKGVLTVLISDNGIGRWRSNELNKIKSGRHQSFATRANSTRLSILNKDQERVGVEYIDKKDELGNSTGTDVLVRIPVNHY